ncbi:hypothetical protein AMTRI_Chr09g19450 [Amborella trichopoda]
MFFKGASLCLAAWSPQEGSFRRQKVWLTLHHVPLHAWSLATFGRIAEICKNLISIRWKYLKTLPLGSILHLVEVLDLKSIPPCVLIEVDNLFYLISLAWSEVSPPSVNLVNSCPYSLREISSPLSWGVVTRKSSKAKRRHRRNLHDHFPGKRNNRPSFSASYQSSQWTPRGTPSQCNLGTMGTVESKSRQRSHAWGPPSLNHFQKAVGLATTVSYHRVPWLPRPGKEVVEDFVFQTSPGLSGSVKDPSSSVGAVVWASVADPFHVVRSPMDEGTHAALKPVSVATRQVHPSPCVPGFHGETNATFQLTDLHEPGVASFHPIQFSVQVLSVPLRGCLHQRRESQTHFPLSPWVPLYSTLTFLPFPFFSHRGPPLFASFLPMEVDPSLLPFGIIMVHSLLPSPPDPSHLSELLGPFLPQPSLLIPLGRITTVLFPFKFSLPSTFNLGLQPFPYHYLSFYTPPPSLPVNPYPYAVSNWALPLPPPGTLLAHHILLLLPMLTPSLSSPLHCRLVLALVSQCPCRLSFIPLASPTPVNFLGLFVTHYPKHPLLLFRQKAI